MALSGINPLLLMIEIENLKDEMVHVIDDEEKVLQMLAGEMAELYTHHQLDKN